MQTTLWKRGLFSSRDSLCCTIFCASEYQAAAESNGIILISMDNLIIPGGLTAKQLQTHAAEWNVPAINWIWLNFSFNGWRKRNRPKTVSNFLANLELWVMAVEHQVPPLHHMENVLLWTKGHKNPVSHNLVSLSWPSFLKEKKILTLK